MLSSVCSTLNFNYSIIFSGNAAHKIVERTEIVYGSKNAKEVNVYCLPARSLVKKVYKDKNTHMYNTHAYLLLLNVIILCYYFDKLYRLSVWNYLRQGKTTMYSTSHSKLQGLGSMGNNMS